MRVPPSRLLAALATAALAAAGCADTHAQRTAADRDAARGLDARRPRVPELVGSLDLDAADRAARPARALERVDLDLDGALRLAAASSRTYRARREDAWLAALDLATERKQFAANGGLGAAAALSRDESGTVASAGPVAELSRAFEAGGSFVLRLAADFLRTFPSDPAAAARTLITADLVLPLLRGSGTVAREPLTQAERDVLYALRALARTEQELLVDVATDFYDVLQAKDVLENEDRTYDSLVLLHERAKSFGPEGAGRMPDFEVDQARQDVLRAEDRRQQARQAFEASLDTFKQTLGIPLTTEVTLRAAGLDAMRKDGLPDDAPSGDPVATALAHRLDLATTRDRLDDARRRLLVAEDALRTGLDVAAGASLDTPGRRPFAVRDAKARGSVGLDLDLPVDRVEERDAYRAAEIAVERARRDVEAEEDRVTSEVRREVRQLAQARRSFGIQQEGVRLAERRVESARLNLQAGKATVRDVLDAENSLIEARNALTAALVDHAVARLSLARDTGTIDVTVLARPEVPAPRPPAAPGAPAPGQASGSPTAAPPASAPAPTTAPAVVPPPAGPAVPAAALPVGGR